MKESNNILLFFKKYKGWIIVFSLFFLHILLRFSYMESKNLFGWDQVNSAWVSLDMIKNHKYPILGVVAKQNTGVYLGPLYYYLVAIFYFFTNLDPKASGIFAGTVSILTFWGLLYFVKKIFSLKVALLATFINTVAMASITFDRVQWNVVFFPLTSLAIFYFLYNVISGRPKFILPLAVAVGLAFHMHFTAVFFLLIILLSLPFFPRNKETIRYILVSIPIFLIWLAPNIVAEIQAKNVHTGNLLTYINDYYHGFHLKRFFQLTSDAFIQFEPFLFPVIKMLKYLFIPFFIFLYLRRNLSNKSIFFCFLVCLWFLVPWIVFSTYKGEISDYYFAINRYIAIAIMAFLINFIFEKKNIAVKVIILVLLCSYAYFNIDSFFHYHTDGGLKLKRENVNKAIREGRKINFTEGVPESYIYYIYTRKR